MPSLGSMSTSTRSGPTGNWADNLSGGTRAAVVAVLRGQIRRPLREPVYCRYLWVERDRRRDKDNIAAFGRKVIQDALVQMGALRNDGWGGIARVYGRVCSGQMSAPD